MKAIRSLSLLLNAGLVAGAVLSFTGRAHATDYPLVCNKLNFFDVVQQSNGVHLTLTFDRAGQGDNAAHVPAGTCAWRDRALRGSEPNCIAFSPARFFFVDASGPNVTVLGNSAEFSAVWENSSVDTKHIEVAFQNALTGRQTFMIGPGNSSISGNCMTVDGAQF